MSSSNPDGSINNSELELAGYIAGNDVVARERDVAEVTTASGTDNTASLAWSTKGAVSATGPAAYLLRLQAMHQRLFRYQHWAFYVPGNVNRMADDCSRLWHLSDEEFVAHFNATYPQTEPWRLCHLNADMASAIHSALRCERRELPEILGALARAPSSVTAGAPAAGHAPWQLPVGPPAHGRRKKLYDLLGRRRPTWVPETGTTTGLPSNTSIARAPPSC